MKKKAPSKAEGGIAAAAKPPVPVLVRPVGDTTLEETPDRVLQFLRGVIRPEISAIMFSIGYDKAEHRDGWARLHAVSGVTESGALMPLVDMKKTAAKAVAEVDAFDERGFRITNAALGRHFPALHEFVMQGLVAKRGTGAVLGVKLYLDRLDELEDAKKHPDGKAALELLAKRGIPPELRKRLRTLVNEAETFEETTPVEPAAAAATEEEKRIAMLHLRSWYEDWAEMARSTIHRRDYLISLGLASRVSGGGGEEGTGGEGDPVLVGSAPPEGGKKRKRRK